MSIISISGKKGSGKDTAAARLIENHGFTRFAFADILKDMLTSVFKIERKYFDDHELKDKQFDRITVDFSDIDKIRMWLEERGVEIDYVMRTNMENVGHGRTLDTPREMMQFIGTDVCRDNISNDLWIDLTIKNMLSSGKRLIVVTDARYANERRALKKLGGILLLIKRSTTDGKDTDKEWQYDDHKTENDLGFEDDYDVVIENNSSVGQLQADIGMWWTLKKGIITRNK